MSGLALPVDAPFSSAQQAWIEGFLIGLTVGREDAGIATDAATTTLDVLYGSQTGTSEMLAEELAAAARTRGTAVRLTALDEVDLARLPEMDRVLVITSTYGEGEMPDNAELFWESFEADTAPRLEGVEFAVLALGDSGYDGFCQAGRLLDLRFEQLGATRILPRVDCDVDFEEPAGRWQAETLALLAPGGTDDPSRGASAPSARRRPPWSRRTPFGSRVAVNRVVSGPGSAKEIRHVELALGDSGIEYHAGDALAVVPTNDPVLADLLLERLDLDAELDVAGTVLGERLRRDWEISTPSRELVALIAERDPAGELAELAGREQRDALEHWLWGKDVLDLLALSPHVRIGADELGDVFRPLQHRAYSISSSPLESPDRIHLTVAVVRHGTDRPHHGVCSTFLADRAGEGEVGIFLQPNAAFRVPDDDAPMIMVGPGTGIAPFRGFLQERAARGATGPNWVFFGDQHRATDFIYREELERFRERGVLTRLDLAFSRDQAEKVYVQTRIRENARELYDWLEDGGSFYVCGDASRMAKDVDRALVEAVGASRGLGEDDALRYVADLKRDRRYVRDVY
ncbi:sulfite reductase flavoprotein subunit alpha [Microbacterium sp. 18062]|uniref:diflavin oxidoreductase n=1 Tax=Microbacterium sp. 18062 TaxID=2681410 RepID=UPI001357DCB1|nr:sulfite reductase flavoprotein subunit alpha [Microbacterium sp. 18062]